MRNTIALVVLGLLLGVQMRAQTIDPTVEVTRQYEARLGNIVKPALPATVSDTLDRFERSTDYVIFQRPIRDLYDFMPYEALQIKPVDPEDFAFLYARLGMQVPVMPSAEVRLQKVLRGGLHFGLSALHDSYYGSTPSAFGEWDMRQKRSNTGFRGDFKYAWDSGEFQFDALYGLSRYNFRNATADAFAHNYGNDRFNLHANIRSADQEENSIYYDFTAEYRRTGARYDSHDTARETMNEDFTSIHGYVGTTFEIHRVYIDMNLTYASFDSLRHYTVGLVEFSPIYEYSNKWLNGKFGIKIANRYGTDMEDRTRTESVDGNDLSPQSSFFPDVDVRAMVVPKVFWVHARVGGGNDINVFSTLLRQVPFLTPDAQLHFGSRPVDAKLDLETMLWRRVALNASASFVLCRDNPVFVLDPASAEEPWRLRPDYRNYNKLSFGAEALWKTQSVSIGGEWRYHLYYERDGRPLTELPQMTAGAYVRYSFRDRLTAALDFTYRSGVEVSSLEIPAVCDLDANVSFLINKHFTIYAKAGNIFNRAIQYIPGYLEPGINFGGGLTVSF